jgi:DNA-binding Xre family transcriptional regulator
MPIRNKIKALASARGDNTNYKFWKRSGLPQTTAYRLYRDPMAYPAETVLAAICAAYGVQPGDCLEYVPETVDDEEHSDRTD